MMLTVPATMSVDSRTRVPVAVAQLFTDHPNVATMDCLCHDRPDWQCSRLNKWKTVAPAPSPSTPVPSNP